MSHDPQCTFCQIAQGISPSHKIWENEDYLAFLSIFPNTEGFSVVIPKEHYSSYVFELPEDVYLGLVKAAQTVGLLLDQAFPDVGRTGLLAEGFGVDHAHMKLFPMHGTSNKEWKPAETTIDKYFTQYEGYLSSHNGNRADDTDLAALAERIRSFSHPNAL